ncbi:hypothetical protein MRX96_029802 [Rhipicephalus microplus]
MEWRGAIRNICKRQRGIAEANGHSGTNGSETAGGFGGGCLPRRPPDGAGIIDSGSAHPVIPFLFSLPQTDPYASPLFVHVGISQSLTAFASVLAHAVTVSGRGASP